MKIGFGGPQLGTQSGGTTAAGAMSGATSAIHLARVGMGLQSGLTALTSPAHSAADIIARSSSAQPTFPLARYEFEDGTVLEDRTDGNSIRGITVDSKDAPQAAAAGETPAAEVTFDVMPKTTTVKATGLTFYHETFAPPAEHVAQWKAVFDYPSAGERCDEAEKQLKALMSSLGVERAEDLDPIVAEVVTQVAHFSRVANDDRLRVEQRLPVFADAVPGLISTSRETGRDLMGLFVNPNNFSVATAGETPPLDGPQLDPYERRMNLIAGTRSILEISHALIKAFDEIRGGRKKGTLDEVKETAELIHAFREEVARNIHASEHHHYNPSVREKLIVFLYAANIIDVDLGINDIPREFVSVLNVQRGSGGMKRPPRDVEVLEAFKDMVGDYKTAQEAAYKAAKPSEYYTEQRELALAAEAAEAAEAAAAAEAVREEMREVADVFAYEAYKVAQAQAERAKSYKEIVRSYFGDDVPSNIVVVRWRNGDFQYDVVSDDPHIVPHYWNAAVRAYSNGEPFTVFSEHGDRGHIRGVLMVGPDGITPKQLTAKETRIAGLLTEPTSEYETAYRYFGTNPPRKIAVVRWRGGALQHDIIDDTMATRFYWRKARDYYSEGNPYTFIPKKKELGESRGAMMVDADGDVIPMDGEFSGLAKFITEPS